MDNFTKGNYNMPEESDKILKIRFKLPSGEEFEAEGTLEFIENQRNHFLALIGKQRKHSPEKSFTATIPNPIAKPQETSTNKTEAPQSHLITQPSPVQEAFPAKRLWEKLFKEEGEYVILRRKMRLEPQEAALLLLAGARVLLNRPECKALILAKMLQKSGFTDSGRLDRLLQPETAGGYLQSEGMKRGRTYRLTNSGFARAFVLAEKLAGELL